MLDDRAEPAPLDQNIIRSLLPHAGRMCLLQGASAWDADRIQCHAVSHHERDHPLRRGGQLRAIAGVEYAAQAIALHGALLQSDNRGRRGYLLSVRDVDCTAALLDAIPGPLQIEATRLASSGRGVMYEFRVRADCATLVTGRVTIRLEAG